MSVKPLVASNYHSFCNFFILSRVSAFYCLGLVKDMALQWSSPVRRDEHGALLSQIPNELYSRILDFLQPPPSDEYRSLPNIALVCRYFSYLAIPRIFDTIEFDGADGVFTVEDGLCQISGTTTKSSLHLQSDSAPRYTEFCRSIVSNEGQSRAMATYVRTCRFASWGEYDWDNDAGLKNTAFATEYLDLFFSAVTFMENITNLDIHWMLITPELLKVVGGLKKLKDLRLCKVSVDPRCTPKDYQHLSSLQLRSLGIVPTFPVHSTSPEDINSLARAFDHSHMESLVTAAPSSVHAIEGSTAPLPLSSLEILIPSIDVRFTNSLFQQLPDLRRLSICQGSISNGRTNLKLDEESIPHLEELDCVPELLGTFVPGRPVSRVAIGAPWSDYDVAYSPEFLWPLSRSTAPSITLSIATCWFEESAFIYDHLQKVDGLKLLVREDDPRPAEEREEMLESLGCKLVRLPQVKKVQFALQDLEYSPLLMGSMNLERQYLALQELRRRPNPMVVQLGRIIWTRRADEDWDLEFEDSLVGCLMHQAKQTDSKYAMILVNDHCGFLKRLLSPYGIEAPPFVDVLESDSESEDDFE